MLCFTIALRGKGSTKNWPEVERAFNATLHSIFNQTDDEFEVYVGCNEIPILTEAYGDRLHFVPVSTPVPQSWIECCRDRAWKQQACAHAVYEAHKAYLDAGEGIFLFPVDADDFVSNRIAEYVRLHPGANGFKSRTGYRLQAGRRVMEITPYYGGTMNIMKLYRADLPVEMPAEAQAFRQETCVEMNRKYPVRWNDIEVAEQFSRLGRPFDPLPFRTTIYTLGSGENISADDPSNSGAGRRTKLHLGVLLNSLNFTCRKYLSKKIKEEFGM